MELTEQQLKEAVEVYEDFGRGHGYSLGLGRETAVRMDALRRVAPHLQLPWEMPSDYEIDTFENLAYGRTVNVVGAVCRDISQMVLREFVRRRNAALQPKPVDPRRAAVKAFLDGKSWNHDPEGACVWHSGGYRRGEAMRPRYRHGVYEERYRPQCKKCSLTWPECKHSEPPKRVVFLAGPDKIWCQLNGTNYPSVRFRAFNDFSAVEMVMPENQFRSKYTYVGKFVTQVSRKEVMG